jgi:hypothetical protein
LPKSKALLLLNETLSYRASTIRWDDAAKIVDRTGIA